MHQREQRCSTWCSTTVTLVVRGTTTRGSTLRVSRAQFHSIFKLANLANKSGFPQPFACLQDPSNDFLTGMKLAARPTSDNVVTQRNNFFFFLQICILRKLQPNKITKLCKKKDSPWHIRTVAPLLGGPRQLYLFSLSFSELIKATFIKNCSAKNNILIIPSSERNVWWMWPIRKPGPRALCATRV